MLSCTPVYIEVCGVENFLANFSSSFLICSAFFSRAYHTNSNTHRVTTDTTSSKPRRRACAM
jgi:hypothetical protein